MKRTIASLLAIFAAATAHAGSFGGPPPFSNGSPLVTGVDGSYQAVARSTNLTGIIRFQYAGGSQTAAALKNSWVFFVNGQTQHGTVTAAIDRENIAGVLDVNNVSVATNANGSLSLPIVIQSQSASSIGYFNGKLSLNESSGAISGSGQIMPSLPQTNTFVLISTNAAGLEGFSIPITNGSGTSTPTDFKFSGVRTFTGTSASTN